MSAAERSWRRWFSPLAVWEQVEARAVQQVLRGIFARWGLPARLRVDNGHPWGSRGDLPSDLALWLIGLGIQMIWNRPRHAQENAIVERSQATTKGWVEPSSCPGLPQLRQRLEWAQSLQREHYPSLEGQTRMQAYPALLLRRRPYEAAREPEQWALPRVADYLAPRLWRR